MTWPFLTRCRVELGNGMANSSASEPCWLASCHHSASSTTGSRLSAVGCARMKSTSQHSDEATTAEVTRSAIDS